MDDSGVWDRCKPTFQRKTSRAAFDDLPYAIRIAECERPENVTGPSFAAWAEINAHLGTHAKSLPELVEQFGQRTFGHTPRVGDRFCGGGSIPFEAARVGCEAFGSDLNPVASGIRSGCVEGWEFGGVIPADLEIALAAAWA